jgi:hypothetical protein
MFEETCLANYSKAELIKVQSFFSAGAEDSDEDIETLQALIYSIMIGQPSVDRFLEVVDICDSFRVSADLVDALLESDDSIDESSGDKLIISENLYKQFFELFLEERNLPPLLKEAYQLKFLKVDLKKMSTNPVSFLPHKMPSSSIFVFHSSGDVEKKRKHTSDSGVNSGGDDTERPLFYLKFYPSLNQVSNRINEINRKYVSHCINFDSFPFGVSMMELYKTNSTKQLTSSDSVATTDVVMEVETSLNDNSSSSSSSSSEIGSLIRQESFLITSSLYDYVVSLDTFFDYLYWQFNPTIHYTSELEGILLELLVCIHDDFSVMINSMSSVLSLGGGESALQSQQGSGYNPNAELQRYYSIILNDLQKALSEEHSGYAIGRLHQSFEQLLEMKAMTGSMFSGGGGGGMFNIPEHFQYKIQQYIEMKINIVFKDDMKFVDLLNSLVSDY